MGEILKNILISYAVCAFCGGILRHLCFSASSEKMFRFIVTAAAVSAAVIPLIKDGVPGLSVHSENFTVNSEYAETDALMHASHALEKNIYAHVSETLINLGVREYEIYVKTETDEAENTVSVTLVRVEIGIEYETLLPEVRKILYAEYGEVLETDVKT